MSSHDAMVDFDWADGHYYFRLLLEQIRELEEKRNSGISEILVRINGISWRVDDLIETIRLGLIGGGATPIEALNLVRRYVEQRPLLESVDPAKSILMAALSGVPEDVVGKEAAEKPLNGSGSPPSTATEPRSGSRRRKSTK